MTQIASTPPKARASERVAIGSDPRRWALAGAGVACVGLGAVGVVVPGLPTTIFLIMATWCFARSCPWLERRLIRNRFFGPYLRYLEPGAVMPRRAVVATLAVMWACIGVSLLLMVRGEAPAVAWVGTLVLGAIGSASIIRAGRPR